nr:hypothetical protein [Paenibacillus sp. Marseille-Q4541]
MDKRVVITAYRQGLINMLECAQILGLDSFQMERILGEIKPISDSHNSNMPRQVSLTGSK